MSASIRRKLVSMSFSRRVVPRRLYGGILPISNVALAGVVPGAAYVWRSRLSEAGIDRARDSSSANLGNFIELIELAKDLATIANMAGLPLAQDMCVAVSAILQKAQVRYSCYLS